MSRSACVCTLLSTSPLVLLVSDHAMLKLKSVANVVQEPEDDG